MALVKRKTFVKQYLKRLKVLLERYLPEKDEEEEMIKIAGLVMSGEIRHIDKAVKETDE